MAIDTIAGLKSKMPLNVTGGTTVQDIYDILDTLEYRTSTDTPLSKAQKILRSAFRGKLIGIMANPLPTVTQGAANANSTIVTDQNAYGAQITYTDTRLTYYSGLVNSGYWGWINSANAGAGFGGSFRFGTDAEAFEIRLQNSNSATFRVMVDGEWTSADDYTVTGDGASYIFYKFDFGVGSSKPRTIDVSFNPQVFQMFGINVGASAGTTAANNPYRIWRAAMPDEPTLMVWGDSWVYGVGIGTTHCRAGFVHKTGEYLGIKSIIGSGVGGQGYLALDNSGNSQTFRSRILGTTPSDIERFGELDMLIIGPTGMNDTGQNTTSLQAEVTLFANEVIARQPKALIAVFGPQRSPALQTTLGIHDAIKAGWQAASGWDTGRMKWFDTFTTPNWFDISTSVGNMQTAIYSAADTGHLNKTGHIYLGRRVADEIVGWLSAFVS